MSKLIFFLSFFALCNTTIGQNNPIKQSDLIGCWKYYPEESNLYPELGVYRPCDYDAFPSKRVIRGRFIMDLRANGICSYLSIGPTDINLMKQGKWIFDSDKNEFEIFDLKMIFIGKFKIVRFENKLLGIKKN